jgi:hypothetical protein
MIIRIKLRHSIAAAVAASALVLPASADSVRVSNRSVKTANINRGGINTGNNVRVGNNVNIGNDVVINRDVDIDVDRRWGGSIDVDHHHNGFWAGVGTTLVVGAIVRSIPENSTTVVVANTNYYYADGLYYVQTANGYSVVDPPVGTIVAKLPPGTTPIVSGAVTYYYVSGTYYVQQETSFVVVKPPIGITVSTLPAGATQVIVNGVVQFKYGSVYYRPVIEKGVTVYTTFPLEEKK